MILKRFVIENYRSCLRTSFDLHPSLSVLIGPNSSGKTNVLQAIMLLNKLSDEDQYGPPRGDAITISSRIRAVFQQRTTQIRLNAFVNTHTDDSNNDVKLVSRQKWRFIEKKRKDFSLEFPLAAAAAFLPPSMLSPQFRSQMMRTEAYGTKLRFGFRFHRHYPYDVSDSMPKWAARPLTNLVEYCMGIRYYGASQFTNPGNCPVSFQIEMEGKRRRPVMLRGHAKILYKMYYAQRAESDIRYKQFIDIVGPKGLRLIDDLTFREVKTSSTNYSVRVGGKVEVRRRNKLLVIPQFKIGRQKLSPNQLSDGTFRTLALLFHVLTEDGTLLLIEEPEVCVHHGLLSSILELIKIASAQKQIIISTHSDYVLDHVQPENVYRVAFEKPPIGTVVRHIPETMTSKEYSALREYLEQEGNLGEFWREGGLGDKT